MLQRDKTVFGESLQSYPHVAEITRRAGKQTFIYSSCIGCSDVCTLAYDLRIVAPDMDDFLFEVDILPAQSQKDRSFH